MTDEKKIAALEAELAALKSKYNAPAISPLAPKGGFPDLPLVKGIRYAATAAGIKYEGRDDVMLMECAAGSAVAGVFTRSATRSANVLDCQRKLRSYEPSGTPVAIIVNSGNSNAFTGREGDASVDAICKAVSLETHAVKEQVFTASTGVIGERLPHDRIVEKISYLNSSLSANQLKKLPVQ